MLKCFLCLSAVVLIAGAQGSTLPKPIASYFEEEIAAYAISPDGTRIAYGRREGSDLMLRVRDLATGEDRGFKVGEDAPLPEDIDKIVRNARMPYVDWATNERLVYKPDNYRLFAIDSDFSDQVELLRYREEGLGASRDKYFYARRMVRSLLPRDPERILVESFAAVGGGYTFENNYDFFEVNIHSGAATPINGSLGAGGAKTLFADATGTIRAKLWERTTGKFGLHVVDPATGEMEPVETLLGPELAERFRFGYEYKGGAGTFLNQAVLLNFGYSPEWMFFGSNEGRDTYAVYAFNLATKELKGPLLENPTFDVVWPRAVVAGSLFFSDYTRSLISISTSYEKPFRVWTDERFAEVQEEVDALSPKSVNRLTGWSEDLRRFTVSSSKEDQYGRVWVFDRATQSAAPFVEERILGAVNLPVWVPSPGGHRILCYLTVPKTTRPGVPNKLVVNMHGGPWARDFWEPDPETLMLADAGYTVLRVNFRGSVGFGRSFAMAAQGRYGDAALEDVMTAIDWCVGNRLAAKGDVVAMGGSYGGYLALYATARHPEVFSRCVAIAAVTDVPRQITEGRADSASSWSSYIFWKEMIGDPRKNAKELEAISPINLVKHYRQPILLIHGEDDSVVEPTQSRRLFKELKKVSETHRYLEVKQAGHGGWSPEQRELIYGALFDFLGAAEK